MEGEVTVTVVLNLTMKINKMEETMDTTTMLLLRAVDVVAVEGEEVVEEEEDVVDTTDRKDHRTMQLLK